MTLLRQKMLVVATAGLLGGLAIATATPYPPQAPNPVNRWSSPSMPASNTA